MLLTLLFWIRNPFGAAVVLAWAVALLLLARRGLGRTAQFLVGLLAIQVALNAVYDIRVLYLVDGPSDAATMAQAVPAAGVAVGDGLDAARRRHARPRRSGRHAPGARSRVEIGH